MASRSLNSPSVRRDEYRGWTVYVRWYSSISMASEGWLCKVLPPGGTVAGAFNLGRFRDVIEALQMGKAWIDRRLDPGKKTPTTKRRARLVRYTENSNGSR